jgi:hypothetical protein
MITYGSSKGPTAYDTGKGGAYQGDTAPSVGPSVVSGKDGPFHDLPATSTSPGQESWDDERYLGASYQGGVDRGLGPLGPDSLPIHPLPGSSTSPGQSPGGGGQYEPVGWALKGPDSWGSNPASTAYLEGMAEESTKDGAGYKVLHTCDIINDRIVSNADPAHEGNWSYEQGAYFPNPGGGEYDYYERDDD